MTDDDTVPVDQANPILIDDQLKKKSLIELLDIYYHTRWYVEERPEWNKNEKYQKYLDRINREFRRREAIIIRTLNS